MLERTLVLIKPDAVQRGLVGEIISRFERIGLILDEMKLLIPDEQIVKKHYPDDLNWLRNAGGKTIETYQKFQLNLMDDLGTVDVIEIGKIIRKWLIQHLTSGPTIAMILSGNHAVEVTRKIVGSTIPLFAELGTIRGDFSIDSPDYSTPQKRVLMNLVHASESLSEANREINLWF
ncbi:MAG: nucleoside-diphosphate kinase [Candidatus Atribacteria bacterium]|nr:nucleoside-diphosphate kinase [Candidatus Atribacteria bacterium]